MDPPDYNQRDRRNPNSVNFNDGTSGASGSDETPHNPDGDAPDGGTPQATYGRPQYLGGFTMIPPNESRRSKLQTMAQKEEEDLQRWREANRVPTVHLNPEKLGGSATMAEAREKQLAELRCSKVQKKLRQEDLDRRKRQEEEEENQKKKDKQREKAERLEERRRQEEQRRSEQLGQDHVRMTDRFLQRFERTAPGLLASSSAHASSRSEAGESKQRAEWKSTRDIQLEHRRVNSAFLDNLEAGVGGSDKETEERGVQGCPSLFPEDFRHQPSNHRGQQPPLDHLNADPEPSYYRLEAEPEYDRALMQLMNSFPDYSRVFLEDILEQCNSDYQQAYTLLDSTMS